jgi:(2S)-methylsuccinyl-CoA dehydrogenase
VPLPSLSLDDAVAAAATARRVVAGAAAHLHREATHGELDDHQVVAYDLAHAAAGVEMAAAVLDYGWAGEEEAALAGAFVADIVTDLASRVLGREPQWGLNLVAAAALGQAVDRVAPWRHPAHLAGLAGRPGARHLDPDHQLLADTFRRFAEAEVAPVAERVHRADADVPEGVISGLGRLGAFGLSVPEAYGGFAGGLEGGYLAMVVATEELSRASLGAGGSLITRPEILARALMAGGTDEQKRRWLPAVAAGEAMVAVAVTEPDYGSDVAGIVTSATRGQGGWTLSGTKTWSTFAARAEVLLVLARTDPDRRRGHRGLSLFLVPKQRADGAGFVLTQPGGGRLEGRPIHTIGYRGMHSYQLSFDGWQVADDCLVGGPAGLGRGFYWQMEGFQNGRLQTAARAVGVMQAAYEAAVDYAGQRMVFGRTVGSYQLTAAKLGRMAAIIQACRQHAYRVAALMAAGEGALEASMVKAYACRAAEWVTREAMQIHGGMGYAEELPVSRYFLDARVLSIFEGADETLALKVIARRLVEGAAGTSPDGGDVAG